MDCKPQQSNSSGVVDIQFEMTRISNGEMHREVVSVPQRDFELSVEYVRSLIKNRFNIPPICQIRLKLGDIPLDCLAANFSQFPSRIHKKGERLLVTLHYYTNCVSLSPVEKMVEHFDKALHEKDYRVIYIILNSLNHDHMDQNGWDSEEAMGTRIFLRERNFLSILLSCISFLNGQLSESFERSKLCQEDSEERDVLLGRTDSICSALDSALAFVWNYGAKCMDRICLYQRGFLHASLSSLSVAHNFMLSDDNHFNGYGKTVFYKCLGVIQGFSELRTPALEIGCNQPFIHLLLKSVLEAEGYSSDLLNEVIQLLIFFSVSCQTEVSRQLCSGGTYLYLLHHFSTLRLTHGYNNCDDELCYIACLVMLNWLKTPIHGDTVPIGAVFRDLVELFNNFFSNITLEDILKFEDYYRFIWGTLDPFTSLFFVPRNSILGMIYTRTLQGIDPELPALYFKLALFSLSLLLKRETSRKQILEENLLTHLIIASWGVPAIYPELRKYYPEIYFLPVPSLYDIAVVQLVRQGQGDYTQLIHPPI